MRNESQAVLGRLHLPFDAVDLSVRAFGRFPNVFGVSRRSHDGIYQIPILVLIDSVRRIERSLPTP